MHEDKGIKTPAIQNEAPRSRSHGPKRWVSQKMSFKKGEFQKSVSNKVEYQTRWVFQTRTGTFEHVVEKSGLKRCFKKVYKKGGCDKKVTSKTVLQKGVL